MSNELVKCINVILNEVKDLDSSATPQNHNGALHD
jgi:hypothetical protein